MRLSVMDVWKLIAAFGRRTVGRFVVNCVDDPAFDEWVAGWNWTPG
jgi:hypothetical protein